MAKFENFLDKEGKVNQWPSKTAMKIVVLTYIAEKFEVDRIYNEKEVNTIIDQCHTFNDYFIIRRGMIENKLLKRTKTGSEYWKESAEESSH